MSGATCLVAIVKNSLYENNNTEEEDEIEMPRDTIWQSLLSINTINIIWLPDWTEHHIYVYNNINIINKINLCDDSTTKNVI